MSEPIIYKGRGSAEMRDDFVDFINYVFGFNGNDQDFVKLLPKLYKPEYDPCGNNYVVTVDGKLKSAIGVFVREFDVMGERICSHGIGNVAVHPYSRSKGYMRELMNMAIHDMIDAGADMSDLGGKRQRYGYFGYEMASPACRLEINSTNIRHCFADVPFKKLEFKEVCEGDVSLLDEIYALHNKKVCHAIRPRKAFLDIAHSWSSKLYAILDGDRFIGYFIGDMNELTLANNDDFNDVARNYVSERGKMSIKLPAYDIELISKAQAICDHLSVTNDQNYTIFNFKKVVGAYLKLKAVTTGLIDGSLGVEVNGYARKERFGIEVKNGVPTIVEDINKVDVTLEHHEAVTFFFGAVSPTRMRIPIAAAWFPLPLFINPADHV
ncbi:MAG: GNAT family N-acetyltransferase [Clostridiales bacterium]|nr:GNAT family N-acetyltransferase [Clostridiales bacterium]